jgi:hypothetical protein
MDVSCHTGMNVSLYGVVVQENSDKYSPGIDMIMIKVPEVVSVLAYLSISRQMEIESSKQWDCWRGGDKTFAVM